VGAMQNASAASANERRFNISREDYERRLQMAAETSEELAAAYENIVKERPELTWEAYVREWAQAIDDPQVREIYKRMKTEDFAQIRALADIATIGNIDNFKIAFDELSNGKGEEIINMRNDLVLQDDTNQRFQRALQLRSPAIGADTVRYDSQGRLVEGQRADKQAFNIAYDTVVETNRERLANISALERDRMNAAESQREKATSFLNFYDNTGYSTALFAQNRQERQTFQQLDESRAFELYKMFAGAAAGITPAQPGYLPTDGGNALISSGMNMATSSLGTYASRNQGNQAPVAASNQGMQIHSGSGTTGVYS